MLKDSIIYKGRIIEYEWTKSKRKTIGISVDGGGRIIVRAPYGTAREQVVQCMEKHIRWIIKRLEEREATGLWQSQEQEKREVFSYLGKSYHLRTEKTAAIKEENRAKISLSEDEIVLYFNGPPWTKDEIKGVLEQWYRERARAYLTQRTDYFSKRIGVSYDTIRIKNQKTRWGSCSSLGNINYNWRIMMAPPEVVDYLVVHELCHRKEMNHSEAFWKLVEKELPDYQSRKNWLKKNSRLLNW